MTWTRALSLAVLLSASAFAGTDADIEALLMEGEVVSMKEIGSGITRPRQVVLTRGETTGKAAFKTVDERVVGLTRFDGGPAEVNFSDRYVYERAAYLLDRELGIGMVPVVVLRTIEGEEGALIEWVSDAVNEQERRIRKLQPPDWAALELQYGNMRLFDALIANVDRNAANQLITLDDWNLHLIDHSRAFRVTRHLPDGFEDGPVLVRREVYERLVTFTEKANLELFRGILSKAQVKAIRSRALALIRVIERDRERFGDAFVFGEPGADGSPSSPDS